MRDHKHYLSDSESAELFKLNFTNLLSNTIVIINTSLLRCFTFIIDSPFPNFHIMHDYSTTE